MARLRENLHGFVERGGTLYASDFQFEVLFWLFPDFFHGIKVEDVDCGEQQSVEAKVDERGCAERLGSSLTLGSIARLVPRLAAPGRA